MHSRSEQDQCNTQISPECQQLGVNVTTYVARVNTEFSKVAALGVSTFGASGDSGAHGRTDGGCTATILHPDFPACSPWLTAVGATMETNDSLLPAAQAPPICAGSFGSPVYCIQGNGTEVAVSYDVASFTSGGGFSWDAPMPSWQQTAVQAYLTSQQNNLPPAAMFNPSGKAFPDIAAIGHNFLIMSDTTPGDAQPVGGTSVASPVVASLFSLLNQVALKVTGKPLGFVSPLLYKMYADDPTIFHVRRATDLEYLCIGPHVS
jgi:tripeptidyl-peptidase-1